MKLLSYHSTRSGLAGLGNMFIRWRLRGIFSHSEVMFEPGDGVEWLVPDGNLAPDASGAYWSCSAVGLERLPAWTRIRAGELGGVRMKRVVPDPKKWTVDSTRADPQRAAQIFDQEQGLKYNWGLILAFAWWLASIFIDLFFWAIGKKLQRRMCSQMCARMFGLSDDHRFDPCSLRAAVNGLSA